MLEQRGRNQTLKPTLRNNLPKIIEEQSEQSIEIDSKQYDSPQIAQDNLHCSPETNVTPGESGLKRETQDDEKFKTVNLNWKN